MIDDGFEEAWKRLQDEISKTVPKDQPPITERNPLADAMKAPIPSDLGITGRPPHRG